MTSGAQARSSATLVYNDRDADDDEIERGDDIEAVMIIRRAERPRRNPLLGLGPDEFGRFAYTWRECEDRLDLIRTALRVGPRPRPAPPRTAPERQGEIHNWRDELSEPASARADKAV